MEKSTALGMKTFDQSLFDIFAAGVITEEEAIKNADSPNNLKLKIKLYLEDGKLSQSAETIGWSLDPLGHEENNPFN